MAEVYARIGAEKVERVIARHTSVQTRLAKEAEAARVRGQRQLDQAASRNMDPETARAYRRGRRPAKLTTKNLKIDHHVFLEGPVAGSGNRTALSIMRKAIRKE